MSECFLCGAEDDHKMNCPDRQGKSVWDNLSDDDPTEVEADWKNHHIEGYARAAIEKGQNGHFKAPLMSHILGNLWMGGCMDGVRLPNDFVRVFSLYPWERYRLGPDTERVEVKMYDSAEVPDESVLMEIVEQIVNSLEEGKTLVHCQAGLNRSGLLSALALIVNGHSAQEAIDLLREKRSPMVLCNPTFERYLLSIRGTIEE